ncbi:MAG: hypothetical protein IJ587_05135 [Synergistaceae bacterium]|nr:hypothetical protein [Synergistaceae bacterium]
MPFLRAMNIPHVTVPETRKNVMKPKMAIRSLQDLEIAEAVKAWIREDDLATSAELIRLGLI